MIPVLTLPPFEQWDASIMHRTLEGCPGRRFVYYRDRLPPGTEGAVIIVPGRYDGAVERVQRAVAPLAWALVVVTGDEAAQFDMAEVSHPNLRWWYQLPRPHLHAASGARFLGDGCPPHFAALLPADPPEKDLAWSYAGQVNHYRRRALLAALENLPDGELHVSPGFTEGLDHETYAKLLARTRIAPCPSGPNTPDTFRVFEALEAGCVPVVDALCPAYYAEGYWELVCDGHPPFPLIEDWARFGDVLAEVEADWLGWANRCQAWWLAHQLKLADWLDEDLTAVLGVSGARSVDEDITVLIPTSPIPSHPSTEIISQTVASVRYWLPDAEIVLMIDGVREEQADRADDYAEYVRRLLWLARGWGRVRPMLHGEHLHQAEMARHALRVVRSPLVLFVEHDAPLVCDEPIPWEGLRAAIVSGELNLIRLHHEAHIHRAEHGHLHVDAETDEVEGVPIVRTMQYSQRPHLASTAFYREMIERWFPPGATTMIEDRIYGVVDQAWREHGRLGWALWRLAIYHPDTGNVKRSYHLDAREGDPKFEETFTW